MKKTLLIIINFVLCVTSLHAQILYGLTGGGKYERGTISKYLPATNELTVVKSFGSMEGDGVVPEGTLTEATDGKLYGLTANNVIFSFDPYSSIYTNLKGFNGRDGSEPEGGLIQAGDKKLYGMTTYGGSSDRGVIFSFDPSTSTYAKLHDFFFDWDLAAPEGCTPFGSLVQASDGKLYGMTSGGGSFDNGVIFSFDPSTSTYAKLHDFDYYNDGGHPWGGNLVQISDGKLYGMTYAGGSSGYGTIFSFDPLSSSFKKLKDFDGKDGSSPIGSLMQASDGKLYGMTYGGGATDSSRHGVIFSFDPSSSTYTKVHDFDLYHDGGNPLGNLMQASDGKLYGMTRLGGSSDYGTIFSFDLFTSGYTKLIDFSTGGYPYDGYGNGFIEVNECIAADSTWYIDADGDGYGNRAYRVKACPRPEGYVADSTDCDDNNKAVHAPLTWYRDVDSDGFGDAGHPITTCSEVPPAGYVTDSTDCNDNNKAIHAMVKYYRDFDSDGFGDPYKPVPFCSDVPPAGYTTNNNDCADSNKAVHGPVSYYRDADGDGFGDPGHLISASTCTPPAGYVFNNTDCDDNNNSVHAPVTYYRDFDHDCFGDPNHPISACSDSPPAGYVINNTDCNDNNKAIHAPVTYYRDYDRDGFGDPYHPISSCSDVPPAGYLKNNYDCYDGEGASEPGYARIRMCHEGWTQCVYAKDTTEKLSLGWTVGLCSLQSCAADETLMCHNGKQECVKTTVVAAKLAEAGGKWSMGPFCSGVPISGSVSNIARKVDIAGKEKSMPTQYSLSNYPNPFAGTSTIKYELPLDSRVSIKVYDLAGRAVATLVDANKKAGTYTVNFNATSLSSGSLFYKIIARSKEGQYQQTNQMVKIQ